MKQKSMNMTEGPLFKKMIIYTVPIILTSLLQLLFNAADLIVIGQECGSVYVGAVGATSSLINLLVNFFIGLSVGVSVSTAFAFGAKDDDSLTKIVHTAFPIAIVCGIILTIVGLFGSATFLRLMGTPDNVVDLSTTYMQIYFCGVTASLIYNFGAAILRAIGDTKSPLIFLTIAGIVNVILNLFFVIVLKMNVAGVALATSISQIISATLIVIALMKRNDACKLSLKKLRFHKKQVLQIVKIGLPAGIQSSLFAISNVIIQSSINSFGDTVLSGNSAATSIEGFVYVSLNAFHQTALNFSSQNFGSHKFDRIKRIAFISLVCVATTGLVLGNLAVIFGKPLLKIYIKDSAKAISYGFLRLKCICLTYSLCGLMDVMTGLIRGIGASVIPMFVTVLGVCGFRILWIFTIFKKPEFHTTKSLYMSYPISWAMTFAVELLVFIIIFKHNKKAYTKDCLA